MKLYKKVPMLASHVPGKKNTEWCIVKLDEDEVKIIGHQFAVSQNFPGDYWRGKYVTLEDKIKWLNGLHDYEFEGFFDTALECFYHIKVVEANLKLESINDAVNKIIRSGVELPPIDYFNDKNIEEDPDGIVW